MTDSHHPPTKNARPRLATVWLDGCSGCHMSLLDVDAQLVELMSQCEMVYGPLVDTKVVPESIALTLVEGAVSSDHDVELVKQLRHNSQTLVALGDCAVTGNVPAMRNILPVEAVYRRAFVETASEGSTWPRAELPTLLARVVPVHQVVPVDLFLPGCPPPAQAIFHLLSELLAGRRPNPLAFTRFGA